jgi:hypothetical protein
LEAAAGEADVGEGFAAGDGVHHGGEGGVDAEGDGGRRDGGGEVGGGGVPGGGPVEGGAVEGEGVWGGDGCAGAEGAPGGGFEEHRGFAFVAGGAAEVEEGGEGVEEASGAGGAPGVEAGMELGLEKGGFGGGEEVGGRRQAEFVEDAEVGAARVPGGGVAAGQREGA